MKLKTFIKELQKLEKQGHGDKQIIVSDTQVDSSIRAKQTQPHESAKGKESVIIFIEYGDLDF